MATERSGSAGAITWYPSPRSRSITPFQLDASAKAPCSSTIVGFGPPTWESVADAVLPKARTPAAVRARAPTLAAVPRRRELERFSDATFIVHSFRRWLAGGQIATRPRGCGHECSLQFNCAQRMSSLRKNPLSCRDNAGEPGAPADHLGWVRAGGPGRTPGGSARRLPPVLARRCRARGELPGTLRVFGQGSSPAGHQEDGAGRVRLRSATKARPAWSQVSRPAQSPAVPA